MLSKFDEMKIRYAYSEYPGGHTWPVWRNNLYNVAALLFEEKKNPQSIARNLM